MVREPRGEFEDPVPVTRWAWVRLVLVAVFLGCAPFPWVEVRGCGPEAEVHHLTLLEELADIDRPGAVVMAVPFVVIVVAALALPWVRRFPVAFLANVVGVLAGAFMFLQVFLFATFSLGGDRKLLPAAWVGLAALAALTVDPLVRVLFDAVVLIRDRRGPGPRGEPPPADEEREA